MEAHVHVVFPQDPIADAGRHRRGAPVKAAAASGPCAVVWERHGRAEELGEFLRRALIHALQRHGEVERVEDALRDLRKGRPLYARALSCKRVCKKVLFCACLAGRLDKYDRFFGLR